MENNELNYSLAIAITIIVVILFFGGWYIFIGQSFNNPTVSNNPVIDESANPIVYGTSTENIEGTSTDLDNIEVIPTEEAVI